MQRPRKYALPGLIRQTEEDNIDVRQMALQSFAVFLPSDQIFGRI